MDEKKNEIILFENQGVKLEVNLKDETVWLNRQQLSELFDRDIKTIGKHINNVLKEELKDDNSVVAKFATTATDGKTYNMEYYNLDMILSVGYRVKSNKGIIFRRWANKILKDYTIKGYSVNQRRLEYLEKTIKLIDIANRIDKRLEGNDAKEILKVIGDYSKALDLLDDYDHRTLKKIEGNIDERKIEYSECIGDYFMANENKKDFNSMMKNNKDMPKTQIVKDEKTIKKYGGTKMFFAPPIYYDKLMKKVPKGKLITVSKIRDYLAKKNNADFTDPMTAGIFINIVAWASYQRNEDITPYWRTLKSDGELNVKYPEAIELQKRLLEEEGHTIISKGTKNIKYYVKNFENSLIEL